MVKKILLFTLSLMIFMEVIPCQTISAENKEENFGYYYSAGELSVYGRDISTKGKLIIPTVHNEIIVKEIEPYAFDCYERIESVSIPDSIEKVGDNAFENCLKLDKINIGAGVKSIGKEAFINTGYYNNINNWDNNGALYIDDVLIKVSCLFEGEFIVKDGTRIIADGAFEGCTKIKKVLFPNTVQSVGLDAFKESGVLNNPSNWIENCLYIGNWLISVKDVVDPDIKGGIKYIADGAFKENKLLQNVFIPEGVLKIGTRAFSDCDGLTEINIPSTVEYIGDNAFVNCNVKTILVNSDNNHFSDADGILYTHDFKQVVFCPQQMSGIIKLMDEVEYIGNAAFRGCNKIEKIELSNTLLSIGKSAFYECSTLKDIHLPDGLKYIGRFAFSYCIGIMEMKIPDSVIVLEENAFSHCANMKSICIGSGIKRINAWTFENCEKLNDVVFPCGLEAIGYLSFYKTALIENMQNYDSEGLLYIGEYLIKAKDNNSGVYNVSNMTILIAMDCFKDCNNVKTIVLPNSLKHINRCALSPRNKDYKIIFHGTEKEWNIITFESCLWEYPDGGIRMVSDFPVGLLIWVTTLVLGSIAELYVINKKQKGVMPICKGKSEEIK